MISCTRTFSSSAILLTFWYPREKNLHFGFWAPKKLTFSYFGPSGQKLTFWYPSRILKQKTYIFVGNRLQVKVMQEFMVIIPDFMIASEIHYRLLTEI